MSAGIIAAHYTDDAPPAASYRLWPATDGPLSDSSLGSSLNLGNEFYVTAPALATHLHFWRGNASIVDTITGYLWQVDGPTLLASKAYPALSGIGWQTVQLDTPIVLTPFEAYEVAWHTADHYVETGSYWATGDGILGITNGILVAPNNADAEGGSQGRYVFGGPGTYPDGNAAGVNYWADVTVQEIS